MKKKKIKFPERKPRIGVVDNTPIVLELTVERFKDLGYIAKGFERGSDILEALVKGEQFDVIIIDFRLGMTEISGAVLTKRILMINSSQKIIGMSSFTNVGDEFLAAGAKTFYHKSGSLTKLVALVRHQLKKK